MEKSEKFDHLDVDSLAQLSEIATKLMSFQQTKVTLLMKYMEHKWAKNQYVRDLRLPHKVKRFRRHLDETKEKIHEENEGLGRDLGSGQALPPKRESDASQGKVVLI